MADFFATVLVKAAVIRLERLFSYLTQKVFVVALDRQMRPA